MSTRESFEQPNPTPFATVVEHLRTGLGDPEQFDLAVKASLGRVKSYAETLGAGKQVSPEQAQMLYEHGFTLLKRELPEDLDLPFARQAKTEVDRKDQETGENIYKQPLVEAFSTAFREEIEFDKDAAEILQMQPAGIQPTTDNTTKPDKFDLELAALHEGNLPAAPAGSEDVVSDDEVAPHTNESEMTDAEVLELKRKHLQRLIEEPLDVIAKRRIRELELDEDQADPPTAEELEEFRNGLISYYAMMDPQDFKTLLAENSQANKSADVGTPPVNQASPNNSKTDRILTEEEIRERHRAYAEQQIAAEEREVELEREQYEAAKIEAERRARRNGVGDRLVWGVSRGHADSEVIMARNRLKLAEKSLKRTKEVFGDILDNQ